MSNAHGDKGPIRGDCGSRQTCEHCEKPIDFYKGHWWSEDDDFLCSDGEQGHAPTPRAALAT